MAIRDRGKMKWQSASFIPLVFEMTSEMFKNQAHSAKPIIGENPTEEFDLRIAYATEYKARHFYVPLPGGKETGEPGEIICADH